MTKYVFLMSLALFISIPCIAASDMMYPVMLYGPSISTGTVMCPLVSTPSLREYSFDSCLAYKDDLDLTSEQLKKLKALRMSYNIEIRGQKARISKLELELDALYGADKLDYKAIAAKVSEILSNQDQLRLVYFETIERTCGILTASQKEKFRALNIRSANR